jgi:putative glycosyltransferase (TIGR04372 family)
MKNQLKKITKKIKRKILVIPFVVFIRLVSPLLKIRFGIIGSNRIGHFLHADWYFCEREYYGIPKRTLDLFYSFTAGTQIANNAFFRLWKRKIIFIPFGNFIHGLVRYNQKWFGAHQFQIPQQYALPLQKRVAVAVLFRKTPCIEFSEKEEKRGEQYLSKLGIPDNGEFVCFHARDSAYLNTTFPNRQWKLHDVRDSNIDHCIPAVKLLTEEGYTAVRMGSVIEKKINPSLTGVVDYASTELRNDFLDVYLSAKCRFFICSSSGIATMPEAFRRPMVYTNWHAIGQISNWVNNALVIPKKIFSRQINRVLTFKEIIDLEIAGTVDPDTLKRHQVEFVENTPEEISEVVLEMHQRLNGSWKTETGDALRQERFWNIVGKGMFRASDLRIGAAYLRKNESLLC